MSDVGQLVFKFAHMQTHTLSTDQHNEQLGYFRGQGVWQGTPPFAMLPLTTTLPRPQSKDWAAPLNNQSAGAPGGQIPSRGHAKSVFVGVLGNSGPRGR